MFELLSKVSDEDVAKARALPQHHTRSLTNAERALCRLLREHYPNITLRQIAEVLDNGATAPTVNHSIQNLFSRPDDTDWDLALVKGAYELEALRLELKKVVGSTAGISFNGPAPPEHPLTRSNGGRAQAAATQAPGKSNDYTLGPLAGQPGGASSSTLATGQPGPIPTSSQDIGLSAFLQIVPRISLGAYLALFRRSRVGLAELHDIQSHFTLTGMQTHFELLFMRDPVELDGHSPMSAHEIAMLVAAVRQTDFKQFFSL
ncbi:hypothetical protein HMN09_01303400 [Mycena chlorophos]|uniref:Uncharacterized protein n=1 Tax=Mycena chlorophos TaxID=658473 RepID=A0A8H6S0K7_MYCCL|nr:hypothetical protein HMN09_01303400 [Mycena chlorophos]